MTREQAKALVRAADALPEKIGTVACFQGTAPHCAIGHIMSAFLPDAPWARSTVAAFEGLAEHFGVSDDDRRRIWMANDDAAPAERRGAVIVAIEAICRNHGHDPDGLRAEIAAEGGGARG